MTTAATATVSTLSTGKPFEDNRERVRCNCCELTQYQAELCRRCKKPLPKPLVRVIIREAPLPVEADGSLFGREGSVDSLAEREQKAIAYALAEADKVIEAARRLDTRKATLYQQVAEIFGKEAKALRRKAAPAREEPRHGTLCAMSSHLKITALDSTKRPVC